MLTHVSSENAAGDQMDLEEQHENSKRRRRPASRASRSKVTGIQACESQIAFHGIHYSLVFLDPMCFVKCIFSTEPPGCCTRAHPLQCPDAQRALEAFLRGKEEPIGFALQSAGFGFGPYTTSELLHEARLSGGEMARSVLADNMLASQLFSALFRLGRKQLQSSEFLAYNPAEMNSEKILAYRKSLNVYRQANALQYKNSASKSFFSLHRISTLPAGRTALPVLDAKARSLGVGPFEWQQQFFASGEFDRLQPDTQKLVDLLLTEEQELDLALNSWLTSYLDRPPRWAVRLVEAEARAALLGLSASEIEDLAIFLVDLLRGLQCVRFEYRRPYAIQSLALFATFDGGESFVPRYPRELDFILASLNPTGRVSDQTLEHRHQRLIAHAAHVLHTTSPDPRNAVWAAAKDREDEEERKAVAAALEAVAELQKKAGKKKCQKVS